MKESFHACYLGRSASSERGGLPGEWHIEQHRCSLKNGRCYSYMMYLLDDDDDGGRKEEEEKRMNDDDER